MQREEIGKVAHAINRAYCASLGDNSVSAWEDAPESHKASILAGVDMHLANPDATPEQSHESWLEAKKADGWKYGKVKDEEKKTHPCFLPYEKLPAAQKAKDYLFRATVHALKGIDTAGAAPIVDPDALAAAEQVLIARIREEEAARLQPEFDKAVAAAVAAAQEEGGSTVPIASPAGFAPVRYVGTRLEYEDGTYGTKIKWKQGETKFVPEGVAGKMFRHPDVYELGNPEDATKAIVQDNSDRTKEDPTQEARDLIASMNKDALQAYAKTNFGAEVDMKKNVDDLRVEVTGMVDRFGTE
jgi:hypothetical protein